MAKPVLTLTEIALVAHDVPAMVRFYDAFFGAELRPVAAYGTTLYHGSLHGALLILCPNAIAGVQAEQSRHQFSYQTPDLAAAVEAALQAGGTVRDREAATATVVDPDGNTIVLRQAG